MKICSQCKTENPDLNSTCTNCGNKFRVDKPINGDEVAELREKIQGLLLELSGKDAELDGLKITVSGKDKEIAGLKSELSASQAEADDLRKKLKTNDVPEPPAPGLSLESFPEKKPNFHIAIDNTKQSIDLSSTLFRIRATIEHLDDALDVVVQKDATLNIRLSANQKWQRYTGGSRIKAVPGMILFDPKGTMNARFEN